MDNKIRIEEVKDKKGFNKFLKFPYKLFKDDKMWVPSLLMDEKVTFNKKKNPAFEFCESRFSWLIKEKKLLEELLVY